MEKDIPSQNAKKVSVIIPCYNAARYVSRCLQSVLSQTIGLENMEVILINDASTDDTLSRLLEYEQAYPDNVLVVDCAQNGRQGRARNIGMSYAGGEYISFIDIDDLIAYDMLEKLILPADRYHTDIAECGLFVTRSWDNEAQIAKDTQVSGGEGYFLRIENATDRANFFFERLSDNTVCTRLYRHSFLVENDIYFPEEIFMEDIYFFYLTLSCCTSIYHTSEKLYYYSLNNGSTMHSRKMQSYFMDVHSVMSSAFEELKRRGIYDILKAELEYAWFNKAYVDLSSFMMLHFKVFPKEKFFELKRYKDENFPNIRGNIHMSEHDKKSFDSLETLAAKLSGESASYADGFLRLASLPIPDNKRLHFLVDVSDGGFGSLSPLADRALHRFSKYLSQNGYEIQIFSIVSDSDRLKYEDYLRHNPHPALIVSVDNPKLCRKIAEISDRLSLNCALASWSDVPIECLEKSGRGGEDDMGFADLHFAASDPIAREISERLAGALIYRVFYPTEPMGGDDDRLRSLCGMDYILVDNTDEYAQNAVVMALLGGFGVLAPAVDGIVQLIEPAMNGYLYKAGEADELKKIVSYVERGLLPKIKPENCVKSVQHYIAKSALYDFQVKIQSAIERKVLSVRYGASADDGYFAP